MPTTLPERRSATCREPYIEIREVINTLDNKVRGGGGGGGGAGRSCMLYISQYMYLERFSNRVHDHAACLYHLEHCRLHSVHCLGSSVQSNRVGFVDIVDYAIRSFIDSDLEEDRSEDRSYTALGLGFFRVQVRLLRGQL